MAVLDSIHSLGRDQDGERFAMIQRVAQIGVFERDLGDGGLWWSPQMLTLWGRDPDEAMPTTLAEALRSVVPEDVGALEAAFEGAAARGENGTVQFRFRRRGELRYGEIRYEPLFEGGEVVAYRGTMQDRTDRKRETIAAEHELEMRARLLDAVDAAVIATDPEGLVTHWNAAAERMYGWTFEEARGRPLLTLAAGPDGQRADEIMNAFIETGRWEGEYECPHRDGSRIDAYVRLAAVQDPDGDPAGAVSVSVDLGERVAMENDLRAARDYLEAVTASMAEGLITLDRQGRLNYMNDAADELLGWREEGLLGEPIAKLASHRPREIAGDWGEGFALADLKPGDSPTRVESERIVGRDHAEIEISYTAAPFESELGEHGTVIVFADVTEQRSTERLARDKLEGLSWIGKIRDALDADRLVPFAQPIVSLASGQNEQHELLVRMLDDEDHPISPGRFLPVAEEFGLIAEIDELMLRHAVELAAQGHRVNVNLSVQSIARPGMSDFIDTELKRTGADPSLLAIELTETALIRSEHAARRFVKRLAELGCSFALDDFGTGYGGFMYLKQLPIDYLKDRHGVRPRSDRQRGQPAGGPCGRRPRQGVRTADDRRGHRGRRDPRPPGGDGRRLRPGLSLRPACRDRTDLCQRPSAIASRRSRTSSRSASTTPRQPSIGSAKATSVTAPDACSALIASVSRDSPRPAATPTRNNSTRDRPVVIDASRCSTSSHGSSRVRWSRPQPPPSPVCSTKSHDSGRLCCRHRSP
jgi:PAS domain S-box-containing protein